jgi:hypothetical protein
LQQVQHVRPIKAVEPVGFKEMVAGEVEMAIEGIEDGDWGEDEDDDGPYRQAA